MRTYLRPDAAFIRTRRVALGWTQRDLAEKAGLSHGYIAMLETTQRDRVTLSSARRIASALKVNVSDITYNGLAH